MTTDISSDITTQRVHWDLDYDVHLGRTWGGRFMQGGLTEKKILANTCPECDRVFVPPAGLLRSMLRGHRRMAGAPARG